MSIIRPLPPSVITAIAAGEVVERPATIVKELLENALDAGATAITVELHNGGCDLILVSDNGHGMDQADVEQAWVAHTTSKIYSEADLENITTLGFRGEALASIAQVSTLTLTSRSASEPSGYQMILDQGKVVSAQPIARTVGTTVTVEHLFQAVPARLKFLKQARTELRLCTQVITATALAHPTVSFSCLHHQQVLLSLPASSSQLGRALQLLPAITDEYWLPVAHQQDGFGLHGLLGKPQLARATNQLQYVFLNKRPISSPSLAKRIKETYGSLLDPRREPAFILHLELSPQAVDVNVHPRKETVQFLDEANLLESVTQALKPILANQDVSYFYQGKDTTAGAVEVASAGPPPGVESTASTPGKITESATAQTPTHELHRTASPLTHQLLKKVVTPWTVADPHHQAEHDIIQVAKTYLVATTGTDVVLVDQHAAHERILYNQFLAAFQATDLTQLTALAKPVVVELSVLDYQVLSEHLDTLDKVGIKVEPFGGTSLKISHLPTILADRSPRRLLIDLIDELHQGKAISGLDLVAHRTIAYLACRSAIKAGDYLTPDQRRELLRKLSETDTSATCPHGRPTTITFTSSELEKLFRRR